MINESIDFNVDGKDHTLEIREIAPTYMLPGYATEKQAQFVLDGTVYDYLYQADDNVTDLTVEPFEDWDVVHEDVQLKVVEALDACFEEIDGRLDNAVAEMISTWTRDGLDAWRTS
jgi:hypothetical protein